MTINSPVFGIKLPLSQVKLKLSVKHNTSFRPFVSLTRTTSGGRLTRCWMPTRTVSQSCDEPRFLVVGQIEQKHWSAIITYRDRTVRFISVRRSRSEEVELYES
jgi:uncharacterized DUF497 family protein